MKFIRSSPLLIACVFMILMVGLFSGVSISMAAFGTSPPWVKNDHMLPGTVFEQVVNLSRSETEKSLRAVAKISGDEKLVEWIKIANEKDLIMRSGQAIMPMKIVVEVPEKAELRDYTGSIFVSLVPLTADTSLRGGEVGITLGANIAVEISVIGTRIYDYKIKSIVSKTIEEGSPLSLNIEVENRGNVAVNNVNGQIDIYDSDQKEMIRSFDFVPLEKTIPANETKIVRMIFEEVILEPGNYWIFVKTFLNGQVVYENRLPQEIKAEAVTIVTPDDAGARRSTLPKFPGETESGGETTLETTLETTEIPVVDLKPAAPVTDGTNNIFLIFGLVGLGFGLIAVIGVIVVLILILKSQQRTLQQVAGGPLASAPSAPKTEVGGSNNNGNITIDAKSQE